MDERSVPGEAPGTRIRRDDRKDAERRTDPTAIVLHEAILIQGERELGRPTSSVAWSGLAAGLTMGLSMLAEAILRTRLPAAEWADLIGALGYTVGFVFVTLGKQQLFTETTLTATLPVLNELGRIGGVFRFWNIVFFTNIAGTLLIAWAATARGLFPEELHHEFAVIGARAAEGGFGAVLMQAIAAGWIIALMVWILPATGSARILVIVGATWLISAAGLAHVIAGSVEVAYAAITGHVGWGHYLFGFLLPALIGNSIGGIVFVAILNHAQVINEK